MVSQPSPLHISPTPLESPTIRGLPTVEALTSWYPMIQGKYGTFVVAGATTWPSKCSHEITGGAIHSRNLELQVRFPQTYLFPHDSRSHSFTPCDALKGASFHSCWRAWWRNVRLWFSKCKANNNHLVDLDYLNTHQDRHPPRYQSSPQPSKSYGEASEMGNTQRLCILKFSLSLGECNALNTLDDRENLCIQNQTPLPKIYKLASSFTAVHAHTSARSTVHERCELWRSMKATELSWPWSEEKGSTRGRPWDGSKDSSFSRYVGILGDFHASSTL